MTKTVLELDYKTIKYPKLEKNRPLGSDLNWFSLIWHTEKDSKSFRMNLACIFFLSYFYVCSWINAERKSGRGWPPAHHLKKPSNKLYLPETKGKNHAKMKGEVKHSLHFLYSV